MNAHSMPFSKIISSDPGAREHYHVPKYQREYTWGKWDWERLLTDIDENDPGYFMGSIICVKDGDPISPGDEVIYEVIDGQQRLTTLSLLMMAIYERLTASQDDQVFEDEEDRQDFQNSLASIRNKLIKKKKEGDFRKDERGGWMDQSKMCFLRVQPSSQNHNHEDFSYLISELGLIKRRDKPRYLGIRSMCKAFRYFHEKIPTDAKGLLALVSKVNQLNLVHISVSSQADAFTLFETLNNRGVPLSATDIIKNKLLAEMERQHKVNIDDSYERWQEIIRAVPEGNDQERFLRHFYNAFRWDPAIRVDGAPRAIKSKIILIYEALIKRNAQSLFERLCASAVIYGDLMTPEDDPRYDDALRNHLVDLVRVNAAPVYQLLLYLFSLPESSCEPGFLPQAVDLLTRYYVRRNVTDIPGTRVLDPAHVELIQACHDHLASSGRITFDFFRQRLLAGGYATYDTFKNALSGDMYGSNYLMTRYLLAKLDEAYHTREYQPDLWARDVRDDYIWTVEHVLPQKEPVPAQWVEMIANGNSEVAADLHGKHVDRLGNLTLSGYNSNLSAAGFPRKQELTKAFGKHKINVGYRNGLALNNLTFDVEGQTHSLATAPRWTADMIDARTNRMVDLLLDMYRFKGID